MSDFLKNNWFQLLQSLFIIGSFLLAAKSLKVNSDAHKIGNLIALMNSHREIWSQLIEYPELGRIKDSQADLEKSEISVSERRFVIQTINHLFTVFETSKIQNFISLEGLKSDIQQFFSYPIVGYVWNSVKEFQNKDFVAFIEASRDHD